MVDEVDKEMSREELYRLIDSLRDTLRTFRDALRGAPTLPSPYALKVLSSCAKFPDDYNEGKRLQKSIGSDKVPRKHECEGGAGFWLRLTGESEQREAARVLGDLITSKMMDVYNENPRRHWLYIWEREALQWLLRYRERYRGALMPWNSWVTAFLDLNQEVIQDSDGLMDFNLRAARLKKEAKDADPTSSS